MQLPLCYGLMNSCFCFNAFLSTGGEVNVLAVTFEKLWQPNYLNHPKSLTLLNLLQKYYFQ